MTQGGYWPGSLASWLEYPWGSFEGFRLIARVGEAKCLRVIGKTESQSLVTPWDQLVLEWPGKQ